jgi:hypothetical protein
MDWFAWSNRTQKVSRRRRCARRRRPGTVGPRLHRVAGSHMGVCATRTLVSTRCISVVGMKGLGGCYLICSVQRERRPGD